MFLLSPTIRSCHQPSAVSLTNSDQDLSPTVIRISHQLSSGSLTNCHQDLSPTANKAVLLSFYRQPVWAEGASSTTLAKSSLPIGALLHVTSNRPFSQSFSSDHRTRCNSQLTQAWLTTPCSGCWTNARKQPFARTTERKHEALIKRQRAIITSLFSPIRI